MKKIVIPYDFSKEAKLAVDAAVQFASFEPSELHIIHVVETPSGYLSLYPEYSGLNIEAVYSDEILQNMDRMMNELVSDLVEKGLTVTSEIVHGRPFESIQKTITTEDADLIIMGSKGATGLKEIFVGSTAERIIRYSKVPVLTVKEPINFAEMSDVVFATDYSVDNSVKLVKYVQRLFGLKIRLLKVYNANEWSFTERTALEKLEDFGVDNDFFDYSYHVIDSPFVTDGILKFAHEQKASLIVMGTHGYKGIGHLIAGSNAEGVANHTKTPIFTIRK